MASDDRDGPTRPLETMVVRRAAEWVAGNEAPAERAAASPEVGAFMSRHARCAVLKSEGPAARVMGQRLSAECLDCGDVVEWWQAPAAVSALAGLN
jgi:hypothetical protein